MLFLVLSAVLWAIPRVLMEFAIIGPDTPATGEATNVPDVTQSQVAATMLQSLGLDYRKFNPHADPPIPGSLKAH